MSTSFVTPSIRTRLLPSWDLFVSWTADQAIYNTDYVEIKYALDEAFTNELDAVRGALSSALRTLRGNGSYVSNELDEMVSYGSIVLTTLVKSKFPVRIAKVRTTLACEDEAKAAYASLFARWMPISAKLAQIRAVAIKGRKPSAKTVAREAFIAKPQVAAVRAKLDTDLTVALAHWEAEFAAKITAQLDAVVAVFNAGRTGSVTPREFWFVYNAALTQGKYVPATGETFAKFQSRVYADCHPSYRSDFTEFQRRSLGFRWESISNPTNVRITEKALENSGWTVAEGRRVAADVRAQFVAKAQDKLGFTGKFDPTFVVGSIRTGTGRLEADISVTLADGRTFLLVNKVVWKVSSLGNHFYQFPSTFHNVTSPAGKKVSMASEKEMNEWFA